MHVSLMGIILSIHSAIMTLNLNFSVINSVYSYNNIHKMNNLGINEFLYQIAYLVL